MAAPGTRVAIVGAGASGTLTAIHLLREASRRSARVELVLVDPTGRVGRGVAFGTSDAAHLLNVRASGMTALPEEPDHFAQWLSHRSAHHADEFVPRALLGQYLEDTLDEAGAAADGLATVRCERTRAVAIRRSPHGCVLITQDDIRLAADAVVVATGLPSAGDSWAPAALREHAAFVPDPWRPGALDLVRRDTAPPADVLVVGSGLTMVDVVLTLTAPGVRADRRIHAVSRRRRLPRAHRVQPGQVVVPDVAGWGDDLDGMRAAAVAHVRDGIVATGDWRPAVDGLRYRLAELWGRLDERDRAEFACRDAAPWNEARHRMAPSSAVTMGRLEAAGRLTRTAAEVLAVEPLPRGGVRVRMSDGGQRDVGWVVNCTGPRADVRTLGEPLLDDLLRVHDGVALATVATGGMGFRTVNGRLVDPTGGTGAPVWTLGALRRGELWESTSVPEIREQASALASDVLDALGWAAGGPTTPARRGELRAPRLAD